MTTNQLVIKRLESCIEERNWALFLLLYLKNKIVISENGSDLRFRHMDSKDLSRAIEASGNAKWETDKITMQQFNISEDLESADIGLLRRSISPIDSIKHLSDEYLVVCFGDFNDQSISRINLLKELKTQFPSFNCKFPIWEEGQGSYPIYRIKNIDKYHTAAFIDNIDMSDSLKLDTIEELIIEPIFSIRQHKNLVLYVDSLSTFNLDEKSIYIRNLILCISEIVLEKSVNIQKINVYLSSSEDVDLFNIIFDFLLSLIQMRESLYHSTFILTLYKSSWDRLFNGPQADDIDQDQLISEQQTSSIGFRRKFSQNCTWLDEEFKHLYAIKDFDDSILLLGESGTGKSTLAELIHKESNRKAKTFIQFNCAAISSNLIQSELFGNEKGAFTGADKLKLGLFELANGGTLFLDEIAEASMDVQKNLLSVLERKNFRRVGGNKDIYVNVRLIFATNQDLQQLVRDGRFREDLYYRICKHTFILPSLRERTADFSYLIDSMKAGLEKKYSTSIKISEDVIDIMLTYNWPGNFREFGYVFEHMVLDCIVNNLKKVDSSLAKKYIRTSIPINGDFDLAAVENSIKDMFGKWLDVKDTVVPLVEKELRLSTGKKPILNQMSFGRSVVEPILAKIYSENHKSFGLDQTDAAETIGLSWSGAQDSSTLTQKLKLYPIVEKYFK